LEKLYVPWENIFAFRFWEFPQGSGCTPTHLPKVKPPNWQAGFVTTWGG